MDKPIDAVKVTVELTAWECERLVLALVQAADHIPLENALASMHHLYEAELALCVKLDKAFNQIIEIYKPYKEVL